MTDRGRTAAACEEGRSITVMIRDVTVTRVRVTERGDWVFVRVLAEDGLVGWGEASQSGDDDQVERFIRARILPHLQGRSASEIPMLVRPLLRSVLVPRHLGVVAATAVSAVEQALWDLRGKALGVPVSELLGSRLRSRLRVYANLNRGTWDRSPEGFAAVARAAVAAGFRAVKTTPFDEIGLDHPLEPPSLRAVHLAIQRVAAVREAIGPDVDLLVDCLARLDRATAVLVARELEPLQLYWLEDPVAWAEDVEGLTWIARATRVPLAAGEFAFGTGEHLRILRSGAVRFLMPDVKHCGGIWKAREIAALADGFGAEVAPHDPSGPVATAASVQLCASLPNFATLELVFGEVPWRDALTRGNERLLDGCLAVPDRPGLGLELDEDVMRDHRR